MTDLRHFRFWCQKVLPLVYDDSLSYYEVLCRVVTRINELVDSDKEIIADVDELRKELNVVQEWIKNFDYKNIDELVREYLATAIFVEITDAGYIVYNIPEGWNDIEFNTTGLDITLAIQPEYGHLVLSY